MVKKGMKKDRIQRDYNPIDSTVLFGDRWMLMEHAIYGDLYPCIAINCTQGFYVYTYESLDYTMVNLNAEWDTLYRITI